MTIIGDAGLSPLSRSASTKDLGNARLNGPTPVDACNVASAQQPLAWISDSCIQCMLDFSGADDVE